MRSIRMKVQDRSMMLAALGLVLAMAGPARAINPDAFEADNDWSAASALTSSAWQAHTIHVTNDLDYVGFSAAPGHVYRMETYDMTDVNFDSYMYLYDASGTHQLAFDDDHGVQHHASMITWTNAGAVATTWYVRVNTFHEYSTGAYNLAVTDVTGLGADAWEPDNVATQATTGVTGAVQSHTLHVTNDPDFIRFDVIANHAYRVAVLNPTPSLDVGFNLYDQTGTNLLTAVNVSQSGVKEVWVWESTYTGVGFAAVYGAFGQLGSYTLGFDDLGVAVSPRTNAVVPGPVYGSPALGADGTIYLTSGTSVYAIVAASGATSHVWHTSGLVSTPALGPDGTVYVLSGTNLCAFSSDGTTRRTWPVGEVVIPFSTPAIGADGTIYISGYERVLAFNPDGTLQREWTFWPGWGNVYSPVIIGVDGTIYVASVDGGVYALDPRGGVVGEWYISGIPYSPLALGADGTVYVCSYDGSLYACAPGGVISHRWTVGTVMASPVIGADGSIYVVANDGVARSLNPNGTTNQTWNLSYRALWSAPVIGVDGTVYVAAGDHLFALNPNGAIRWACPGIYSVYSSPTIAPDGTLYFANIDGRLLSISGTGGLGITPWPKYSHDVRNTGRSGRWSNKADFDGDGKADPAVFRSASGDWSVLMSGSGHAPISASGMGAGFQSVVADYDGDGKNDPAVYLAGAWVAWLSGSGYAPISASGLGCAVQLPVPADYDGDGKADPAVFHPGLGAWQVMMSGSGYALVVATGFGAGQTPVPADYDGDGKADPAIFVPASGAWFVMMSGSGYALAAAAGFGAGQTPAPADYDGDGKADPAAFFNGYWTVWQSRFSYVPILRLAGDATTLPAPADYDGDGKADPAVYQPATGGWTLLLSSLNYAVAVYALGGPGYLPAE